MSDPRPTADGEEVWRRLGEELVASDPAIGWSTMMGYPCLRVEGAFFASLDARSGDLLVKLPAEVVRERVAAGAGRPFAPAGRVFREWLALPAAPEAVWRRAMAEALAFVRGA